MNGSFTQHTVVQARSESPTLGLDDDEDASAMLAALDIKRSPSRAKRLAPAPPGPALTRSPLPAPPSTSFSVSTPDLTHHRFGHHSRRGSLSSSDATSVATPAESLNGNSVRESTLLPRGSHSTLDSSSRGSASSQYGRQLETLPEDGRRYAPGLSKTPSTSRKDYQVHHLGSEAAPPSAFSSHQAQVISALGSYQMDGRMPVPDKRLPSVNAHQHVQGPTRTHQGQNHSYLPYLGNGKDKHLSANTECSTSSSYSADSHRKVGSIVVADTASTVSGLTDFHIHLDSSSSINNLSRFDTGSSGSTKNSQALAKKEKKA